MQKSEQLIFIPKKVMLTGSSLNNFRFFQKSVDSILILLLLCEINFFNNFYCFVF